MVVTGFGGTGTVGQRYTYIGETPLTSVDLNAVNYTDTALWQDDGLTSDFVSASAGVPRGFGDRRGTTLSASLFPAIVSV